MNEDTMKLSALTALSPLDGRYESKISALRPILSEYGLIYYRCVVEVHWLIQLAENETINPDQPLTAPAKKQLLKIIEAFSETDAMRVKAIESTTNHDVKAVEYFLQEKLKADQLDHLIPLVHFGCTSEDINNLAYALMFKTARHDVVLPDMQKIIDTLKDMAKTTADIPMLAKTHGQPASPTLVGKEIFNVIQRLVRQYQQFSQSIVLGKCNGAVGNFNAHAIAYPEVDWPSFSETFVTNLGLSWNAYTTQIEPHDWIAEAMHALMRFNTILIDFNRDTWGYISLNYFSQKKVDNEVGSSTMPHKINPIDFENSEGNLGVANALAQHFANKLPISRWQRDLTDSTVLRNLGSILAYSVLAYQGCLKGLNKLVPNESAIQQALNDRWEVLAEAIQSVMRRYGIADAYEQLKAASRGKHLDSDSITSFINQIDIPDSAKDRLLKLTPANYTGCARQLLKKLL
jgi:adenylosuccinate lyase